MSPFVCGSVNRLTRSLISGEAKGICDQLLVMNVPENSISITLIEDVPLVSHKYVRMIHSARI